MFFVPIELVYKVITLIDICFTEKFVNLL